MIFRLSESDALAISNDRRPYEAGEKEANFHKGPNFAESSIVAKAQIFQREKNYGLVEKAEFEGFVV